MVIQQLFVAKLRFLQLVAGDNKTAFLLNLEVPCFENRGDTCFNAIVDSIGGVDLYEDVLYL